MLNRSASLAMPTSVLKALPGKLDIKRHSPSILYIYGNRDCLIPLKWYIIAQLGYGVISHQHAPHCVIFTLVNVYVDLVVFTRFAGTS